MKFSTVSASRPTQVKPWVHNVLVLAFDEVTASDVCGIFDVFSVATKFHLSADQRSYQLVVASVDGRPITSFSGIQMATTSISELDLSTIETLVVPGGGPPESPPMPPEVIAWLEREGRRAKRLCGICTGTFLLAEAGLVGERRVTTHWQATAALQARFPSLHIEADRVYVQDQGLWTSGGFNAGLDLALALLEEDLGHATAMKVASSLLIFLKRPGDHPQRSEALSSQVALDHRFSHLHAWMMEHLADDLKLEVLAARAGMSPRTFTRHYTSQSGRTPAKAVEAMRFEAALRAMNDPSCSLKQSARMSGFGDEQNLRRAFLRLLGATPEEFRRQN